MEKKEYLNEERYQKTNGKVKLIALCVLSIGILIGGSIIATGAIKTNEVKKENEEIVKQIEQEWAAKTRSTEQIQNDIDSLEQKIDTVDSEVNALSTERTKIFREDSGFSDRYYEKDAEIDNKKKELSKLKSQLSEYEHELNDVESGYTESKKKSEISSKTKSEDQYDMLYGIGGLIILMSIAWSGMIYMTSKRREILAYQTQQIMPIAQEGMEKMAPSVAKVGKEMAKEMAPVYKDIAKDMAPAYGEIAKEIAKGMKDGMKDEDK